MYIERNTMRVLPNMQSIRGHRNIGPDQVVQIIRQHQYQGRNGDDPNKPPE
jgi:hypothetical protein